MNTRTLFLGILFFISITVISCKKDAKLSSQDALRLSVLVNSVDFFQKNAYVPELECYLSEIDNNGNKISEKIHLVALSRLVYALAYLSTHYPESGYLERAEKATNFILENMLLEDEHGKYFATTYLPNQGAIGDSTLGIWVQSYGFCGMTELYRITKNPKLLAQIHPLFDAYNKRFRDLEQKGCFDTYNLSGQNTQRSKSFQSVVYPTSAFMANLWEADQENTNKYEAYLAEHLEIAYSKLWNPNTNWVNVTFDQNWNLCGEDTTTDDCFDVNPGHNFQLAWFLIRAKDWDFIPEKKREQYESLGKSIIQNTLNKPIWDEDLGGGFFEKVEPKNDDILSFKKSWWQHTEAIIALSFAQEDFEQELIQLETFFYTTFPDFKLGNEFFYVDEDNQPILEEWKGSLGKSSYHVAEMIKYLLK